MREDIPLQRKLGYDYLVEMAKIRAELCNAKPDITGIELHFEAVRTYENRHVNDPSYRERQQRWLVQATTRIDPYYALLDALIQIADGHNDPGTLARETLALVGVK
jgi:hypothetical protein